MINKKNDKQKKSFCLLYIELLAKSTFITCGLKLDEDNDKEDKLHFHLCILNWWVPWKGLKFLRIPEVLADRLDFENSHNDWRHRRRRGQIRCQSEAICRLAVADTKYCNPPPCNRARINFLNSNLINFRANLVMKLSAWQIHTENLIWSWKPRQNKISKNIKY